MSTARPPGDAGEEEPVFRSLAAPGLDEDDLYAAIQGLPVPGALWGEGRPWAPRPVDPQWDEAAERRRRHDELMRKWAREWPATEGGAPPC